MFKLLFTVLLLASAGLAQCPLGITPEEACTAESPSCALFADGNGDGLCDNPGPQTASEPEPEPEPEPESEPEPEPETEPEVSADPDPFCPLGYTPAEACESSSPGCALFTDGNGDGLCDNPGPQPVLVPDPVSIPEELTSPSLDTDTQSVFPPLEDSLDYVVIEIDPVEIEEDSAEAEQEVPAAYSCPLNFTPEEACQEENPVCALYTDSNGDGRCDNPGTQCPVEEDSLCGLETPSIIGCPLGLPPEGACPDSMALCPHWYGVTAHIRCANPSGGERRINIVLISLAVLLPVSTFLSRKFYGRRLKDRLKRNTAHHVIRGVSLMILGFGVQGCFCPLGAFQYLFTAEGVAFLGLSGLAILLLPMLFSVFYGRVFCGWVCPMGAVQEFLYRIHVPGRISPRGKVHSKLRYLNHVILFGLIAAILLNRYGIISLKWNAPFCQIDPFHTIFTLFLSGSLIIAGVTILLSIFVKRFFCRYLCFYGAALTILGKLRLYSRTRGMREPVPEMDSDEEFDK